MNGVNIRSLAIKTLLLIAVVAALVGCAPSLQWWRVGNCLVLYEEGDQNRRVVVAGQECDIKREDLPRDHGMARSFMR